eukprot:3481587-Amphidinium_carterae.1
MTKHPMAAGSHASPSSSGDDAPQEVSEGVPLVVRSASADSAAGCAEVGIPCVQAGIQDVVVQTPAALTGEDQSSRREIHQEAEQEHVHLTTGMGPLMQEHVASLGRDPSMKGNTKIARN